MDLIFNIDYKTAFGEELVLNIINNTPTENDQVMQYKMITYDGINWTYRFEFTPDKTGDSIDYYYSVQFDIQQRRHEWLMVPHRIDFTADSTRTFSVFDHWHDIPEDAHLYTSAMTDCIYRRPKSVIRRSNFRKTVRLIVRAPQLRGNERLAVMGSGEALGDWHALKAVEMSEPNINEWMVDLDATLFENQLIDFKFVVLDTVKDVSPLWESGLNRIISLVDLHDGETVVYELPQAYFPIFDARLAGTLVPVFSLRTKGSFGVGDFGDLKTMVDYVAQTGQRVLQILPVNDSTTTHTWTDSYPYSCISIFALHPQFVDLRQLPALADETQRKHFEQLREELNALPQIDYERVNKVKIDYLRLLYAQEGKTMMATRKFKSFFAETEKWLVPYAAYCTLRDRFGTADFSKWKDHQQWNESDRAQLVNSRTKAYKEVEFWYFVQFILDSQLKAAHQYANQKRVILKGDIPIGVNRFGCDVWMEPQYFNLNGQAGAPPDSFSIDGQNWGFPTYNWDEMLSNGCLWWVHRLQNMSRFFDAYRIDHLLGFFRIWQIPIDAISGLLGQFQPSLGMTREEIEAYGLRFNEQQFCDPFISNWVLDRVFGNRVGEVKEKYLDYCHDDIWKMKPEYNTQRKVEKAFSGVTDQNELNLRDGLYSIIADVLFIRDAINPNLFHPRIIAQYDFAYEALCDSDKTIFNRLYDDYFYHRHNQFWYREAMKKLPKLIEATRMLVCAEDLGMVPECVPWVMSELRMFSLEIQSMPKDSKERFGHLSRYPYRSVCTFSSHDMPTLRQWWDEDYDRTQDYYNNMLHRGSGAPHPLPGWLARDVVSRQLTSPSMLCILSLQDWLSIDENLRLADPNGERINVPSNPHHYWRYRMHINIEDLMANKAFTNNVKELVRESGR